MTWVALFAASLCEVVWALALKQSKGFTVLWASVVFVIGLVLSMALLAYALRSLPVGTAYAIWTGTGAVGTALVAIVALGESAAWSRIAAIGLIAAGIVWLSFSEA